MNTKISHGVHKKELLLKNLEHKQKIRQIQEAALKEAKRLAKILVDEFGVEEVLLVGPLTYDQFTAGMSLELALDGISKDVYAKAFAHLRNVSTYGVELIDMQHTDSWTKRSIKEKGRLLAKK